jgi:predicted nucleotidyltransferase
VADEELKHVLLQGVVGSTAYGLATPESDIDRLGIFAWPTTRWFDLTAPRETLDSHDPDICLHEVAKACRLMLGGNPTVTEILWLDDYEMCTSLGADLVGIRHAFLSAERVRNAYLGYATQQFHRLLTRGKFDSDIPERRVAKHARHLKRLIDQGFELYTTGELHVRLLDPQSYRDFGDAVAADPQVAVPFMAMAEEAFARAKTVLPEKPDVALVESWLRMVRHEYYWESGC